MANQGANISLLATMKRSTPQAREIIRDAGIDLTPPVNGKAESILGYESRWWSGVVVSAKKTFIRMLARGSSGD